MLIAHKSKSSSLECKEFELIQAKADLKEAKEMECACKALLADSFKKIALLSDKRYFTCLQIIFVQHLINQGPSAGRAQSNEGSINFKFEHH